MTPERMRELADELDKYVGSPTRASYYPSPVLRAADFLRQCAEQRPVAYKHTESDGGMTYFVADEAPCEKCVPLYTHPAPAAPHHAMLDSHRRLVEQAIHTAEHPSGMSTHDGKARIDASVLRRMLAIIDSLPAAPQAGQPIDLDAVAMQQMRRAAAESTWMPAEYSGSDWISDVCRWLRDGPPQAEPIDPHMIVAEDRFPDVLAERWKPCPQCGEDVDRECPICDGLGRVLATDSEQTEPKPAPASGDDLGVYKGMADSYRNDAEPTGAPYGIIDPDYGRVYTIARKLAWEEGYAIGLHGSFTRDLDMIAVPWTDSACEPEHLIRRIVDATGLKLRREPSSKKPHGRLAWSLHFPAFGDPRFVDLSVMPSVNKPTEAQIEAATVALYSYFGDEQSRLFLKSVADDVLRSALAAKDE